MLVSCLQEYSSDQVDEMFMLHVDPKQGNKIVLTETQFNLVKKVYTKCFLENKFSLYDNQLIVQFFLNLKAMHGRINRNH